MADIDLKKMLEEPEGEGFTLVPLREEYFARDPSDEQTHEALMRAKVRSMESFHLRARPPARRWVYWGWAPAFGALALFLWFGGRPRVASPPAFHGKLKITARRGGVRLQTSTGSEGEARAKHWSVHLSGQTELYLAQPSERSVAMRLGRGYVMNRITPKKMSRFVISVGQAEISVKGTRFSCERGRGWLRVEVFRGEVGFKGASVRASLLKMEGLRYDEKTGATSRYTMPLRSRCVKELVSCQMSEQLAWLKARDWGGYVSYANDLIDNRRFPREKRLEWLDELVESAKQRKLSSLQFVMARRLFLMEKGVEARRNALWQAVDACRVSSQLSVEGCLRTTREFLRSHGGVPLLTRRALRVWLRWLSRAKEPGMQLGQLVKERDALRRLLLRREHIGAFCQGVTWRKGVRPFLFRRRPFPTSCPPRR